MAEEKSGGGWFKGLVTTVFGLVSGAGIMYLSPLIDKVIKPSKPLANFAVQNQGLEVTFQNHSTGGVEGWWDFGDGSALEPYTPDQNQIPHKYEKPGTYTVKLSLRNLIGDENDRTVNVNVGSQGTTSVVTGPVIEAFEVTRLRPDNFAPATFKLSAKVKNADMCLWCLGDERPTEMSASNGALDRMVTFRKPGEHKIKLVAVSGKVTVEKTQTVQVQAASATALMAVVQVSHEATHVQSMQKIHTIAQGFPPQEKGNTYKFTREILPEPGFVIKKASFVKDPDGKVVSKPVLQVSPDGKKAILSGELTRSAGFMHRNAPTPNWVTQVVLTQEHRDAPIVRAEEPIAYPLQAPGTTLIPLRKLTQDWETRNTRFTLELHEGPQVLWKNPDLPRNVTLLIRGKRYQVNAVPENDQVRMEIVEVRGTISQLDH
jgi:PKD repeat protein